jgi:hypothetical protein
MSFLENNFFLLAVTFGVFFFAKLLQKNRVSVAKSDITDYRRSYYLP